MIKNQQKRQTAGSETGVQGLQIWEQQIYLEESGNWPSFRLWRGAWAGTGWEWEKGFGWEGMKPRAGWVVVVGYGENGPFTYPVPRRRGHTSLKVVQNRRTHPEECPAPTCYRKGHIINPDSGWIQS